MALRLVYGNSGNGKSEYMFKKIAGMAQTAPYQHYFVLVPEQFTMSTQKSLVEHSENGVITNADVLSFERLAYRIFDELGVHRTIMEETGKSLVLRRIVEENEDGLSFLKKNLTKMGYIEQLKSVISELMQYEISPEDLKNYAAKLPEGSALSMKLADILCIYDDFMDYLGRDYVTAELVLEVLNDVAAESELLRGSVILFDGYTGFTPVQMNLVRTLMSLAKDIYVTVTLDCREEIFKKSPMENLFYMSHKMVSALAAAAREVGCEIAEPLRIDAHEKSRFCGSPTLAHLEKNIFRVPSANRGESCGGELNLFSLPTPRDELDQAANRICGLVMEKGYHFRDIALVVSDMERYDKYAAAIFALYDIPLFLDEKQSILYHPLTELIRALMEMAQSDYSYESVFRFLKAGLSGFTAAETDILENYCIENGVRGAARWGRRFIKPFAPHGRVKPDENRQQEELATLNALRLRIWEMTGPVVKTLAKKDATVTERTNCLYEFLVGLKTEEQLRKRTEQFEAAGDEISASVNRQTYRIVIDLLDKLVDLLGDEVISLADYADILEAGFVAAKVGAIPPGGDCVIMGDMERTRLADVKVLFFLGVNDGAIPKKTDRQSILSQYDREVLAGQQMELAPDERERVFMQRFYLYLSLTKPSDALWLTFSRTDSEGKTLRPSYLVATLSRMFGKLKVVEIPDARALDFVTPKSSVGGYLSGLAASDEGDYEPKWLALHRWYAGNENWNGKINRLLDAHYFSYMSKKLGRELAEKLYGSVLYNSVTRLEMFENCAFAHYLDYGLKLAERRENTFMAPDMGTMFHAILQKYGTRVDESVGWDAVTKEQSEQILREAMEEAVLELPNESLTESARNAYVLERIYRILKRSLWAMTLQLRQGDFFPAGYEVDFKAKSEPVPGVQMRTVGSVDRVDLCETEDRVMVSVTDYKSGKNSFNLSKLYSGLQLQLVVYLSAALNLTAARAGGKKVVPAGIFYFHLDDPMLDAVDMDAAADDEYIERAIIKSMKLDGLVNMEPAVYLSMDRDILLNGKSDVIPVSLKKDGTLSQRGTSAASTEDFLELTKYVSNCMDEAAGRMMAGDIGVAPVKLEGMTGCDYCDYRGICGFDLKVPGYDYRKKEKLKDEEVWELIREENGQKQ